MMQHHTQFGYKKLSDSEDVFRTKPRHMNSQMGGTDRRTVIPVSPAFHIPKPWFIYRGHKNQHSISPNSNFITGGIKKNQHSISPNPNFITEGIKMDMPYIPKP